LPFPPVNRMPELSGPPPSSLFFRPGGNIYSLNMFLFLLCGCFVGMMPVRFSFLFSPHFHVAIGPFFFHPSSPSFNDKPLIAMPQPFRNFLCCFWSPLLRFFFSPSMPLSPWLSNFRFVSGLTILQRLSNFCSLVGHLSRCILVKHFFSFFFAFKFILCFCFLLPRSPLTF